MALVMAMLAGLSVMLLTCGLAASLHSLVGEPQTQNRRFSDNVLLTIIGPIVVPMAERHTSSFLSSTLSEMNRKLVLAGKPLGGISAAEYFSCAELAGVGVLILLSAFGMAAGIASFGFLMFTIVVAMVTFWLCLEYVNNMVTDRRKSISRTFPYYLDLAVMTTEAGSSFREATEIYVRDAPASALVEELQLLLGELRYGVAFETAVQNFEHRIASEEVQNTLRALLQGERMGTPLAQVLRDQADTIRFKRTQLAERAAEEIKVRMQGPAMLLMFSVLLLILGPALIAMFVSGVI